MTECLMIYYIKQHQSHPWIAKASGKVLYFNDWNIAWTYISYLLPLAIAYGYSTIFFRVLKPSK